MRMILTVSRSLLAVVVVLSGAAQARAQLVYRVADLPTGLPTGSEAKGFTALGPDAYFSAWDAGDGEELWRTDGTEAGTRLVRDLAPGPFGARPRELTPFGGRLFFAIDSELAVSDGTAAGTARVVPRVVLPEHLTVAGSLLFFAATDEAGEELWRTDGTPAGTRRVKDIAAGQAGSAPDQLTAIGSLVYFAASGPQGRELWRSDGTESGTVMVADILPGPDSSDPRGLARVGARVFFEAASSASGRELWSSDGSPAGTALAADSAPLGADSHIASITDLAGEAFYTNDVAGAGRELWRSDGTAAGTRMVADIQPGDASSQPEQLVMLDSVLYFVADDGLNGFELWRSDGTEVGTSVVRVLHDPFNSPDRPRFLTRFGSVLAFVADDGQTGVRLWRSDGTEAGTIPVGDEARHPEDLAVAGDRLFFTARLLNEGREPHVSDGTAAGTRLLRDIEKRGAGLAGLTNLNESLLFGVSNYGIWRTDGTAESTRTISINGTTSIFGVLAGRAYATYLPPIDGLLFLARTTADGSGLEFVTTLPGPPFSAGIAAAGRLFFVLQDVDHGGELWQTDGTAAGTGLVRDINPGPASSSIFYLTAAGSQVFFYADDGAAGFELWRSDGTEAGTVRVKDIRPGPTSGVSLGKPAVLGSAVLFGANDGVTGAELWRSDGSEAGTVLVKDIDPIGESTPQRFVTVGGQVFFTAGDQVAGLELWRSDGTEAGTGRVADLAPGIATFLPFGMGAYGDRLVFSADDGVHGREPWITDGTAAGTALIEDIAPGIEPSVDLMSPLVSYAGVFFFDAYTPESGLERWRSDGTAPGTQILEDLNPGPASAVSPFAPPVPAGNHVYFPATNGATGTQLWAVRIRPDVQLSPVGIDEGSSGAPIPVAMTATAEPAIFADLVTTYTTRPGTATPGSDYLPVSGTLTFSAASTTASIALPVVGDLLDEHDETLFVDLTAPLGPPLERMLTLRDDDPRPRILLTGAAVVEGDAGTTNASFTVALSEPSGLPVAVQYTTHGGTAIQGTDFADTSGFVKFPLGSRSTTVVVPVLGDTLDEPDERFELFFHSPQFADLESPVADGVIRDDDGEDIELGELTHGQDRREDLAGSVTGDYFLLQRPPYSSFEVVLSGASGDFGSGPTLERVSTGLQVIQDSLPSGAGHARSLRIMNNDFLAATDYVRVRSLGCSTDCGTDDVYTLQVRETTLAVPRINNDGTTVTLLVLQNLGSTTVLGRARHWGPSGSNSYERLFSVAPRGVTVINTQFSGLHPTGSMTIRHDGAYGQLVGKAVTFDPSSGFAMDTPFVPRVR